MFRTCPFDPVVELVVEGDEVELAVEVELELESLSCTGALW